MLEKTDLDFVRALFQIFWFRKASPPQDIHSYNVPLQRVFSLLVIVSNRTFWCMSPLRRSSHSAFKTTACVSSRTVPAGPPARQRPPEEGTRGAGAPPLPLQSREPPLVLRPARPDSERRRAVSARNR